MLILAISPDGLMSNGQLDVGLIQAMIRIANQADNLVAVISNHAKPSWFDYHFGQQKRVKFFEIAVRQNGKIISEIAKLKKISPHDILVLAVKADDIAMAKNGRAVLVPAAWSREVRVRDLGLLIASPGELEDLVNLTAGWQGQWWFEGHGANYSVRALVDLSTYGKNISQQEFARKLTATAKGGGARLAALLAIIARSMLLSNIDQTANLLWGVYPSSSNVSKSPEVLTEFTRRLRTTTSLVRYATDGEPLFIRHSPSVKRSTAKGIDRNDATDQIMTLHLNPFYKGKIKGRNVVVIDDCTTYGLSFGVAAAFLKAAGASSVHGVAIGKFGNQLSEFAINITGDVFSPIVDGEFHLASTRPFQGKNDSTTQDALKALIP
ncbi:hypothetical protein [Pseudomonas sp. RIT-PI-S]|uniref:hypothetical protein n=1 Tax=Pseudomonas sp. RIT-PI-S TaxID=3035295 RepID=UPI0021D7D397|nr:hypothetical protein [Pseudomonas sp. RIT-PI-S]